jgi:endo-1,4-beta-xylanase
VSPSPSTGSSNSGNNGSTGGAPVDSPSSSQTPTATATATPTSTPEPVLTPTATPTAVVQDPVEIIPAAGDISGHWAYDYIIKLLEKKIIKGYNDGTIKPDGLITRAEVAVIIVKAKGLEIPSDTKTDFVDDDSIPEWAKGYVKAAYEAGIIKGYDDKKFKAFNILTRKEMAAMTMRAFGYEESSATLNFIDNDSIPDWAKGYIAKAVELEIIKGYKDNTFKPDGFITRAESFTILAKCLEREK